MKFFTLLFCALEVYGHLRRGPNKFDVNPDDIHHVVYHERSSNHVVPVSTMMQCCLNLTVQYFFLYTFLAILGSMMELRLQGSRLISGLHAALEQACQTVNYAPMLAVLFLGVGMRSHQLTGAEPSVSVQLCMELCTGALAVQALLVMVHCMVTGEVAETEDDGALRNPSVVYNSWSSYTVLALRYLTMLLMYACLVYLVFSAVRMESSADISPALSCVIFLSVQYFSIALLHALARSANQLRTDIFDRSEKALTVALSTTQLAPMLAILFIGVHMRATQLGVEPPHYAVVSFYVATYATLAQAVFVILVALFGGEPAKGRSAGDFAIRNLRWGLYVPINIVRYLALFAIYVAVICIFIGLSKTGVDELTDVPRVSTAMVNVSVLTVLFFIVYSVVFCLNTFRDLVTEKFGPHEAEWIKWIKTADAARLTVQQIPMLCVLLVACRSRALRLTGNQAGPQVWAQRMMTVSSISVCSQVVLVILIAWLLDVIPRSKSGLVVHEPKDMTLSVLFTIFRYIAFLCLYGGLVSIVISLFVISPETAGPL